MGLAITLAVSSSAGWAADRVRPNVIVILVDDLGWADLGCYGSRFHQTPHLDRMAREGLRFTDAYSACTVCSPTRAALLTGKSPARLHLTDWIAGHPAPKAKLLPPDWSKRLDPSEPTVASRLKTAGYATASIGKWHLGAETTPEAYGFDVNVAGDHRGQPPRYVAPYDLPKLPDGPAGEFLTDRECSEALAFIEKNRSQPFFLYLPHYAVHTPIAGKTNVVAKYEARTPDHQRNPVYAALLESVDDSVGRIRAQLDTLGLATNTVILFTSDNGGLVMGGDRRPTSNFPLRSGKGDVYEGGVRVPLLAVWPGVTKPGTTTSTPVQSVDVYPTVLEIAGVEDAAGHERDGASLVPLLQGKGIAARSLYWHYPHYHPGGATPYGAVRSGDWKMIQFYESGHVELYNLASDLAEQQDLANAIPEKANALAKELAEWRTRVGAQMPVPNPNHEPAALRPRADGSLLLAAHHVVTHGKNVQYEPPAHKNTVGFWTIVEDWVHWDLEGAKPGLYEVEILQGCGTGSGGSEVELSIGDSKLLFTVMETGGFQKFMSRRLGTLEIPSTGRHSFQIRPKRKPGVAVMDVRQVILRPVPGPATPSRP
jgi:arylsulfatase A-like enzyme